MGTEILTKESFNVILSFCMDLNIHILEFCYLFSQRKGIFSIEEIQRKINKK